MVSVAIFSVVMVIALGALLSISAADRKAETLGSVMSNLNFALESMTRTIRTGYDYHCDVTTGGDLGDDCKTSAGGTLFKFTSASGADVIYKFDSSSLCQQTGTVQGCVVRSTDNGTTYAPITAPEVIITNISSGDSGLTFYLRGSAKVAPSGTAPDNEQPNVVITVVGYVLNGGVSQTGVTQKTPFYLQTSVTQRLYDR